MGKGKRFGGVTLENRGGAYLGEGCLGGGGNSFGVGTNMVAEDIKIEQGWATIKQQKTKKESSKIVFVGDMSADVVVLTVGIVLGGGRQREEKKKENKTVYRFLPILKNAQRG